MSDIDDAIEFVLLCEDANRETGERAKRELTTLRADLARLTEERDEAVRLGQGWMNDAIRFEKERDALTEENARLTTGIGAALSWLRSRTGGDEGSRDSAEEILAALEAKEKA